MRATGDLGCGPLGLLTALGVLSFAVGVLGGLTLSSAYRPPAGTVVVAIVIMATLMAGVGWIAWAAWRRAARAGTGHVRSADGLAHLAGDSLEVHRDELRARERELQDANRHLLRALRSAGKTVARVRSDSVTKSEFLASVSHEVRTPLTAILGYMDLLAEGCPGQCAFGKTSAHSHIATVTRNAEHLLHVINDILDFSKIEAGKLDVERITCSPIQVVAEVSELMRVRAAGRSLALDVISDGPVPTSIVTDPTRLRQILLNLLGNAIKFTPAGCVQLVVRLHNPSPDAVEPALEFEVRDTGIGMTAEQLQTLFQPFTQAERSTSRRFGGTGLGLAISKQLVEKLGGTITVESKPGQGSVFRARVAIGKLDGVEMLTSCDFGPLHRLSARADVQMPRLRGRVLLAEDGPDNQRLIDFVLRKAGLNVVLESDGRGAVEAALAARDAGGPFDIVLMDMQMPVLDGYEATRKLRESGYDGAIIALTAHALSHDRDKCLAAGCDDYVAKPIDRRQLLATIQRHVTAAPITS